MGRSLILDTTALVALERRTFELGRLDVDDEAAVAAVTVAEFRVGVELADSQRRARQRAQVLTAILEEVPVLDYTEQTARHHARLLAHVRRTGTPRGALDLVIAAHALQTGRTIASFDARARFGDLPGVTAISPE